MSSRRGFTLIELLLVVSIIALLVALLLPSVQQAKENAHIVTCKARMRQLFNGHAAYSSDFAGQFPHYNNWLWTGPKGTPTSAEWVEYGQIWGYVKNREMYFCPKDDRKRESTALSIGNKNGNGDVPIHTYVRMFEPHDRYAANLQLNGLSSADATKRAHYLRPKAIRPGAFAPLGGSTIASQYAYGPSGPQGVALLFEEASSNTDVLGPDTAWAVLNDGYSFFSGLQDMMTQRHKGFNRGNGHIVYWDGHAELVDSIKFNDWPTQHDPTAESEVFGIPLP